MLHTKFRGNRPRCREQTFVPPTQGGATYNLALIGSAVLEKKMFEHCERRTDAGPDEYPISSPMSLPGSVCCFLEQETFTPQKYW